MKDYASSQFSYKPLPLHKENTLSLLCVSLLMPVLAYIILTTLVVF